MFFKKKKTVEEKWVEFIEKNKDNVPPFDYFPVTLLKEYLDRNSLSIERVDNKYRLKSDAPLEGVSYEPFTTTKELFAQLRPYAEKDLLKDSKLMLDGKDDNLTSFENILRIRACTFGNERYEGYNLYFKKFDKEVQFVDLFVNHSYLNIDAVYGIYYDSKDLREELSSLKPNDEYILFGVGENPQENISYIKVEDHSFDVYDATYGFDNYSLDESKHKKHLIGKEYSLPLEEAVELPVKLVDGEYTVYNTKYAESKGLDPNVKYPVKDIKEWIDNGGYLEVARKFISEFNEHFNTQYGQK